MPEGDTIFRTAENLRSVLERQQIVLSDFQQDVFTMSDRSGRSVTRVESRGKHLLIHFDDEMVLHSHMGMTGSWHVYRNGERWQKPASWAACVMQTNESTAVCFTPKSIEFLSTTAVQRHPYLSRLGPDLMSADFNYEAAISRFRVHDARPIGEAIMNQTIVCGIGNVYKSEVLYLQQANPFELVERFSDEELESLLRTARKLMQRNRAGYPRTTRLNRQGGRKWVYGRSNERCFECGAAIAMRRQGELGRSTYWCPKCQEQP